MSDPAADALSDRISHALADAIAAGEISGGGMADQFVLVGTTIDAEGEARTVFSVNNGARLYSTLGLLDLGQTVWRSEAIEWARGEPDDE